MWEISSIVHVFFGDFLAKASLIVSRCSSFRSFQRDSSCLAVAGVGVPCLELEPWATDAVAKYRQATLRGSRFESATLESRPLMLLEITREAIVAFGLPAGRLFTQQARLNLLHQPL